MRDIRNHLMVIKQLEESNIKSIDRYLKRGDDSSINAIIRREHLVGSELKKIISKFECGSEGANEA